MLGSFFRGLYYVDVSIPSVRDDKSRNNGFAK